MEDVAFGFSIAAVGAGLLLCALRVLKSPSDFDRVLALDTVSLHCVAVVLLVSIRWRTSVFYELALTLALLGFIVTMAAARYLGESHARNPR